MKWWLFAFAQSRNLRKLCSQSGAAPPPPSTTSTHHHLHHLHPPPPPPTTTTTHHHHHLHHHPGLSSNLTQPPPSSRLRLPLIPWRKDEPDGPGQLLEGLWGLRSERLHDADAWSSCPCLPCASSYRHHKPPVEMDRRSRILLSIGACVSSRVCAHFWVAGHIVRPNARCTWSRVTPR